MNDNPVVDLPGPYTHKPDKWRLVDLETGEVWKYRQVISYPDHPWKIVADYSEQVKVITQGDDQ